MLLLVGVWLSVGADARGQDSSAAPFLQIFEAKWETVEERMPDIFVAGYGRLWLPPPARADSGGLSVGYDVYDRFDLGSPRNETLYGTKDGLKTLIQQAHTAGIRVNTDFIPNHNGFRRFEHVRQLRHTQRSVGRCDLPGSGWLSGFRAAAAWRCGRRFSRCV